jgi:hypothetical protein
MAEKLGLTMGRPNLEAFADTMLELAKADRQVVIVTSDSRGSGKLGPFGKALPQQLIEVGIRRLVRRRQEGLRRVARVLPHRPRAGADQK